MLRVVYFHLNYYNFTHIYLFCVTCIEFSVIFCQEYIFLRTGICLPQVSPLSSTKIPTKRPKIIFSPKIGYSSIGFYNGIHIVSFYNGKYP